MFNCPLCDVEQWYCRNSDVDANPDDRAANPRFWGQHTVILGMAYITYDY